MKAFLLVLILGVFHYANATGGKCHCAVFLRDGSTNHPVADAQVYTVPDQDIESCAADGKTACSQLCYNAIDKVTDGGKLDHKNKEGKTVGEIACGRLARNIVNGELGAFVKVCDGEWEYTHGTTPKHLCCENNHSVACH